MNVFFIRAMEQIFSFGEKMKWSIQRGEAELNGTFHLSPHENICTIALINIHYLYTISYSAKLGKNFTKKHVSTTEKEM